ncbi:ABC transporter ATP-binding protein [bacterium]|jgi:zinc transport system ATP-binding protein|nr:ABC transporter ATP-binding protein [bacterium]
MKTCPISCSGVTYSYPNSPEALRGLSFEIAQGDYVAIMGPNGGGKSTLVSLLLGLISPNSGSIKLFGDSPKKGRKHIGYLPQHPSLDRQFPISVIETVMMGALSKGAFTRFDNDIRELGLQQLKRLQMEPLANRPIADLSGGEFQRVLIARALMTSPKLLILDEPTSSIDQHSELCFYDLLDELNQTMTIIMVTHDMHRLRQSVNKVIVVNRDLKYVGAKSDMPESLMHEQCHHG